MYGRDYDDEIEWMPLPPGYHQNRRPVERLAMVPVVMQSAPPPPPPLVVTRDSVWTTYDGTRVRVRDMAESHLFAAAAYLQAARFWSVEYRQTWRRAFLDELQRRVLGTPPEGLTIDELDCLTEQTIADTAAHSAGFYHDTMREVRHGVVDPPSRTR